MESCLQRIAQHMDQKNHLGEYTYILSEYSDILVYYSGRFKLNIRPGKKKSAPNAQERNGGSQTPTPSSDKEKHQMAYRDDQALFSSVPAKLSARTFSHGNFLGFTLMGQEIF